MPTFAAPTPVPVLVDVPFGNLYVVAGDRDDVVVTVLPADPGKSGSVKAAEETRVERDGDAITIVYPSSWKQYVLPFASGGAKVTIELPVGSDLRGKAGSLYAEGRLGSVDLNLNGGNARLDDVDRLDIKVSAGSLTVGRAAGPTSAVVSAGGLRIREVDGDAVVKVPNGTTEIGRTSTRLQVNGAHGEISIGRSLGETVVRCAHGNIRVEQAASGSLTLASSYGSIEVGVPEGTAAWLDAGSQHGEVRNLLEDVAGPDESDLTVEVRASTSYGDVVVRRPHA
ncbi:DUF4097 family beta strand repeat protein [Oerskovia sp. Sa1BUA8]|uniref:DUF4097 family beta strand repeat protein n=1 Tax=Oerskovia douganii TaxID=2762210 RepID=A0A9D5UAC0_9CELL|nr:DUF4097 family beta strand repeat-containing protein [Oerskovia douganii]MBE7701053.1 DUF4097 family beta strand repeat protein [Oerskovia douganii]